jgi:mannose-6-phosphate isomerase-like protein (cupin superfamily)
VVLVAPARPRLGVRGLCSIGQRKALLGREVDLEPGYTVFVPAMEEHQFTNTGEEVLRFVCLIPLLEQG